jgi:pyruvate/2-oxoglutarate dehydrogenase complex dihydrolipoamide dehydrogenase (E3) component
MSATLKADICIIGAGSGGLSVAAGAAQLGRKVILIERHLMGGDCLNFGCVPSKALIAAASHAHHIRRAPAFGVSASEPVIDFPAVMKHVQEVIAAIEPNDSVERFEKLGVQVIKAEARFVSPTEVEAGKQRIRASYFIVATGSSALKPPIPGLDATPFFTNETVFANTTRPDHLIVIGGGPIGMELAQAHRRLGSRVTILEARSIMPKDDAEAVAVVRQSLTDDGVEILEGTAVTAVSKTATGVKVTVSKDGATRDIEGSHILLAAGRAPNVSSLNLEAANVRYSKRGIEVDRRLRSSNPRVYAIGDVAGGLQFTHVAGYHAGLIIRHLLFKAPVSVNYDAVPWCTYTDPELAHVGMTEQQAKEAGLSYKVSRWPLHDNDRAQAERETHGFAKVIIVKGRPVGATVVGYKAGELILPWVMAISQKMKMSAMAGLVAAYPTMSEVSKRAASAYFTPTLFSRGTRTVVNLLSMFSPSR